jgi:DNA-binding MarR family transcriptional regulator
MAGKSLQQELGKKKPFESPEKEAMLNIARTSDQFQNRFGKLFRSFGLTGSQHNVLRILRGEGHPMRCDAIRRRMIQVVPAMTGLLDRLEKDGFVTRTRCEKDGRVVHVDLTAKARAVLQKIDGPLTDLYRECLGHLSRDELEQLSSLLEKARQSLRP